MASPQPMPSAAEPKETDLPSAPLSAVPCRVQELKSNSHKRLKARSKDAAHKDVHRSQHRRWREQVISNLDVGESFSNHVAILKILRRIPKLRDHVPQLVGNDPVTQTYVVQYPRRGLVPLEREVRLLGLSYGKMQDIKSQLYRSVKTIAEMDQATSIINEKNAAIDSAKADLTEAQAIMAEAYQVIKDARAAMDGVKAISKEIFTSVTRPQSAWDHAHLGKEYAETSRRRMDVLSDRANALIQKYGNPKLHNEVGAEDAMSRFGIKPEDNVKVKNRIPTISDIRAMEESTIRHRSAAIGANLREDGSIGT
ncbi:hypothetical protein V8C34DRAFT_325878 [Trichoderma compactum]